VYGNFLWICSVVEGEVKPPTTCCFYLSLRTGIKITCIYYLVEGLLGLLCYRVFNNDAPDWCPEQHINWVEIESLLSLGTAVLGLLVIDRKKASIYFVFAFGALTTLSLVVKFVFFKVLFNKFLLDTCEYTEDWNAPMVAYLSIEQRKAFLVDAYSTFALIRASLGAFVCLIGYSRYRELNDATTKQGNSQNFEGQLGTMLVFAIVTEAVMLIINWMI